jgi:hypothetical protein
VEEGHLSFQKIGRNTMPGTVSCKYVLHGWMEGWMCGRKGGRKGGGWMDRQIKKIIYKHLLVGEEQSLKIQLDSY